MAEEQINTTLFYHRKQPGKPIEKLKSRYTPESVLFAIVKSLDWTVRAGLRHFDLQTIHPLELQTKLRPFDSGNPGTQSVTLGGWLNYISSRAELRTCVVREC